MPENRGEQAGAQTARRTEKGQWAKGQSGNSGGRPAIVAEVRELARAAVPKALKTLVDIAGDEDANPSARVAAAAEILNRAAGKSVQGVEVSGPEGKGLSIKIIRQVAK